MKKNQAIIISLLFILSISLAFWGGYIFNETIFSDNEFPTLSEAYALLTKHAFDDIPEGNSLEYGMIQGMVNEFGDPYTIFVEPPQHELQSNTLQGSFGGIGAELSRDIDGLIILHPIPNGPADLGGIEDGDQLLMVEDVSIKVEHSLDDVVAMIRGPEGEDVSITIFRPANKEEQIFVIERGNIPIPSVTWHLAADEPRLGIVQINVIADSTPDEILNAVDDLRSRGATHFALDLRGNRGGLLDAGIDTADLFLNSGSIIEKQFRGEDIKQSNAGRKTDLNDIPLVVLVDRYTASAAEIIAGALQVNERAILIGEQTFGKDSIQLVFDLRDGSSLHVTAARWWFPGLDFPVNGAGLIPNIIVDPNQEFSDPVINAAITFFFG